MGYLRTLGLGVGMLLATALTLHAQDVTGDIWSVCGDDGYATWHDTRLVFTQQEPGEGGQNVAGYFEWRSSEGHSGREQFVGTITQDGAVALQGMTIDGSSGLVTSRYVARLSRDGRTITNGEWLDGAPGIWGAVRDGGQGGGQTLCSLDTPVS